MACGGAPTFVYQWSLQAPAGSAAAIVQPDGTGANPAASFQPDVPRSYVVLLLLTAGVLVASAEREPHRGATAADTSRDRRGGYHSCALTNQGVVVGASTNTDSWVTTPSQTAPRRSRSWACPTTSRRSPAVEITPARSPTAASGAGVPTIAASWATGSQATAPFRWRSRASPALHRRSPPATAIPAR